MCQDITLTLNLPCMSSEQQVRCGGGRCLDGGVSRHPGLRHRPVWQSGRPSASHGVRGDGEAVFWRWCFYPQIGAALFCLTRPLFQTKLVQKAMNEKRFDEAVKLRGG